MSDESELFDVLNSEEDEAPKSNRLRIRDEYSLTAESAVDLYHGSGIYIRGRNIGCAYTVYNPYMSPRSQQRSKTR